MWNPFKKKQTATQAEAMPSPEELQAFLENAAPEQLQSFMEAAQGQLPAEVEVRLRIQTAQKFYAKGDYHPAREVILPALPLVKNLPQEVQAQCFNECGFMLYHCGDHGGAIELFQKSLQILEEVLGSQHPQVATSLNNLAALLSTTGRYDEAEPLYKRALQIDEKALGKDHPDVATDINNLALLLKTTGKYEEAEPLYKRALQIREAALGSQHPQVATSLNNLAGLLEMTGRYEEAEPLYKRALQIREAALGTQHPQVATSLNNLAALLETTGRYEEAEPLFKRALQIQEAALGSQHPDTAQCLNNLAGLLKTTGRYEEAEPLSKRALQILEAALGSQHPQVATSLNNLAEVLRTTGRYEEAEPLYKRALQILEAALGSQHPDVATSLNNLAGLLEMTGRYEEAEPLYKRALQIREAALGTQHPDTAQCLNNFATYLVGYGTTQTQWNMAWGYLIRSLGIGDRMMMNVFPILVQEDRLQYARQFKPILNATLTLALSHFADNPKAIAELYEVVLRRKEAASGLLGDQFAYIRSVGTEAQKALLEQYLTLEQALAEMFQQGVNNPALAAQQEQRRQALEQEKQENERQLAALIPEINAWSVRRRATRQAVALSLPENGALVEFVKFPMWDFKTSGWLEERYVAFVVPAGEATLRLVDLGEAASLDALIATFLAPLTGERNRGRLAGLLEKEPPQDPQEALRARVLPPSLQTALGDAKALRLAPDGLLLNVPFDLLFPNDYQVIYYTSGRDAVTEANPTRATGETLIMADPEYTPPSSRSWRKSPSQQRGEAIITGLSAERDGIGRLPAGLLEAEATSPYFDTMPLTGSSATVQRLLQAQAPQVLYLITHGLFAQDFAHAAISHELEQAKVINQESLGKAFQRVEHLQNFASPLDLCGIALAGAGVDMSGVATGRQLLGTNLHGTFALLPDCSTGRVLESRDQGMLGLRSALAQAGCRSALLTLWPVDDLGTAVFMERFCYFLVLENRPADQALKLAQARLRSIRVGELQEQGWYEKICTMLDLLRKETDSESDREHFLRLREHYFSFQEEKTLDRRPFDHPRYWAAFILQGSPQPLRG